MNGGKAYLYYLISIVIVMAVVVIVYASIQAGMFDRLLLGVVGLGVALLVFSWIFSERVTIPLAKVRLDFIRERNRNEYERLALQYRHRTLPAPKKPRIQDVDPRRGDALKLLEATIIHKKYGPDSDRIISADDAQAARVMNRTQRQNAIRLLAWAYGVYTNDTEGAGINGTFCKKTGDFKTVQDIYDDMLYGGEKDTLEQAVLAIPAAK